MFVHHLDCSRAVLSSPIKLEPLDELKFTWPAARLIKPLLF
jgi:hypothetical protein